MRKLWLTILGTVLFSTISPAQTTFDISGTPISQDLLRQNYGNIPKGIGAYDLSICNVTDTKQSIVGSRIYQALAQTNASLEPIGRQIMLASILRNQSRSVSNMLSVILSSTTGVLSVVSSTKYKLPSGLTTAAALGSLSAQQILTSLKPVLSSDQLEKFESQVLEPALVLDGGSCVERTVFVSTSNKTAKSQSLSFHIH